MVDDSEDLNAAVQEIINDDFTLSDVPSVTEVDVTPREILKFAKHILLFLGMVFVLSGVLEHFRPGSNFFEACKVTLPSLATLVIGYYFGTAR